MKGLSNALLAGKIQEFILENVMATPWREAVRQGLVYVHTLTPDFRAALLVPELRHVPAHDDTSFMLGLVHALKARSAEATELCLPYYAPDVGLPLLQRYGSHRLADVLEQLFSLWSLEPRCRISLNFGDDLGDDALTLAATTLHVLDQGATFLEPQIVLRVRQGVNLERGSSGFKVLYQALDMARTRPNISFALMDSPQNRGLMGLLAFTHQGLRLEPAVLDFYQGTRDQIVGGKVSVNVPRALSFGLSGVQEALDVAARLLATHLEFIAVTNGTEAERGVPLVINLSGLNSYPVSHALFETMDFLDGCVKKLRDMFNLNFVLASTGEMVPFAQTVPVAPRQHGISALVASMEQYLPGGHCLWLSTGAHQTPDDLYNQILEASEKGISFLRFSPDDMRCANCHLFVAAIGPCPRCGSTVRRKVAFGDVGLGETVGEGRTFQNIGRIEV
ncbi:MAG: hypothetical protein DDT34_00099 [Firmicutes bacterium]|nr:hypothetical protein [Bacillota bacterium]